MRAILFDSFGGPLRLENVADPVPTADGAVIEVRACGVCRSDWYGWQGLDPDIVRLPHVPGHELAGVVAWVGCDVTKWRSGDRVTMPFVAGCGRCAECLAGHPQVCDAQFQPGFTHWGAFAEWVAVRYADFNLVRLPEELDFVSAASLGCRLATAYRAVVQKGKVGAGQWVAIHGCGGLGTATVMIAAALEARIIAVDIRDEALSIARQLGAEHVLDASATEDVPSAIWQITRGGANISFDTFGSATTCANSVRSLGKRGRHVQVGLLAGDDASPPVPMELVVARELEIYGSHGLAVADYAALLQLVTGGRIDPRRLVGRRIALEEVPIVLQAMGHFDVDRISVVDRF